MIEIEEFTIAYDTVLFDKCSLSLEEKKRYCLVGKNGIGKSTLLKHINLVIPNVLYVEQEADATDLSVIEDIIASDKLRGELLREESELLQTDDYDVDRYVEIRETLDSIESDNAYVRACTILYGLQFSQEEMNLQIILIYMQCYG